MGDGGDWWDEAGLEALQGLLQPQVRQPPKSERRFSGILTLDIGAPAFDLWLPILGITIPFTSMKTFKRLGRAPSFWNLFGERPLGSPPEATLAEQF